jgi:hypothetical protein
MLKTQDVYCRVQCSMPDKNFDLFKSLIVQVVLARDLKLLNVKEFQKVD